jgi:hypothetical protein
LFLFFTMMWLPFMRMKLVKKIGSDHFHNILILNFLSLYEHQRAQKWVILSNWSLFFPQVFGKCWQSEVGFIFVNSSKETASCCNIWKCSCKSQFKIWWSGYITTSQHTSTRMTFYSDFLLILQSVLYLIFSFFLF